MEIIEQVMFFNSAFLSNLPQINNEKLTEEIYKIKKENEDTSQKSNLGGWQSHDIPTEMCGEELVSLTNALTVSANEISKLYSVDRDLKMSSFWININGHKDSNLPHNHPKCILSGCYYVDCDDDSGKIVFERPDMQEDYMGSSMGSEYTFITYSFQPKPGDFIIFPSYLRHYVEQNLSNKKRISIAFNWK